MPYRPLTEDEQRGIEARLASAHKVVEERQRYIRQLETELEMGNWYSDISDLQSTSLPSSHCYLCSHSTGNRRCLKGCLYGTVCKEYRHFIQQESV